VQDYNAFTEVRPSVLMGKPVIKGSRITVELILEKLAAGETLKGILQEYPSLKEEAIFAALGYAAMTK
jgi:uncharacterized protein (DUF433 family)